MSRQITLQTPERIRTGRRSRWLTTLLAATLFTVVAGAAPASAVESSTTTVSPTTATPGPVTYTVTVAGASGTPTGLVGGELGSVCGFLGGGVYFDPQPLDANGQTSFTVPIGDGCRGSLSFNYLGDSVYAPSNTSLSFDFSPPPPVIHYTGFFQPLDNPPTVNVTKAGQSVPIKFSLGGDWGLNILAAGSPSISLQSCAGGVTSDLTADSAGGSGLSYDAITDTYTYAWKTSKSWAGMCGTLHVKLSNGTDHTTLLQFK